MLNRNERFEQLKAKGVNTGKYFTVDLDNGTKIHLIIDENGNPVRVDGKENDPILNQIIDDGYVRNTKLFRRFVCAQMFHALNYVSYDGKQQGYNDYIRTRFDYKYTFKMMTEEARVLSKLEVRDKESFEERAHFFDRNVIAEVIEDHLDALKEYVGNLPTHKCKGVPYKKVNGTNIFVADFEKKLYAPVARYARQVRFAQDYEKIYYVLRDFVKNMVKLPYNTKKSKAWLDAYKGEGAFYTLKNLVMFHDCFIEIPNKFHVVRGMEAVNRLNGKLNEYKGEGWRMFALMKKVIADNGINTKTHIAEVCKNK